MLGTAILLLLLIYQFGIGCYADGEALSLTEIQSKLGPFRSGFTELTLLKVCRLAERRKELCRGSRPPRRLQISLEASQSNVRSLGGTRWLWRLHCW